jgi:hypothetical protein
MRLAFGLRSNVYSSTQPVSPSPRRNAGRSRCPRAGRGEVEIADRRHRLLLRTNSEWPRSRGAAAHEDQFAPSHPAAPAAQTTSRRCSKTSICRGSLTEVAQRARCEKLAMNDDIPLPLELPAAVSATRDNEMIASDWQFASLGVLAVCRRSFALARSALIFLVCDKGNRSRQEFVPGSPVLDRRPDRQNKAPPG